MKTNEATCLRLSDGYRIALSVMLGALLAGACGGVVSRSPSIGSESHFLAYCGQGCGAGLDCIGGICTRPCLTDQGSCSDLATSAACTNQSVEPGEVAVCDVSCADTSGCAALGADYACDHAYCRRASGSSAGADDAGTGGSSTVADAGRSQCESFRDQSPPPDVREISVTNTGSVALYIQPPSPDCLDQYPLYELDRDGQTVNVAGILRCGASCEKVIDEGWPYGPNITSAECQGTCPYAPPVLIQPGQTLHQPVSLEVVAQQLPRLCAQGFTADSAGCFSRVIPQPGNYQLIFRAARELHCASTDCDCRPDPNGVCTNRSVTAYDTADLVFTFSTGSYFQNQTFEISAPND